MQRSGSTPTGSSTPFFSSSFFSSSSRSRPGTSSGEPPPPPLPASAGNTTATNPPPLQPNLLVKDRKGSFGRRASVTSPSRSKRRASSSASAGSANVIVTDSKAPPALPDFALAAAAKISRETDAVLSPASGDSFSKMLGRTQTSNSASERLTPMTSHPAVWGGGSEASIVHLQIQELANKRISTLDYLRKAHESRVYWFNTVLFDRSDLQRFPYLDPRKLARRATNYLLLGISIPAVADLNSSSPFDLLRSLNSLLQEFEAFQHLHAESGASASSLSRARLPQMFRRGPAGKSRRSNSSANDIGLFTASGGVDDMGAGSGGIANQNNANVVNFAHSETDLFPGEEYDLLLTPALPFEPDYFETFATLCDVLIDVYTRLLTLMPTPAVATAPVAELFAKMDGRVRKIIVQGAVKEFEEQSRAHAKTEVANIGKVVLGGLM